MLVFKVKRGIKCFIKWKNWRIILDITVALSTVASLLVVFLTLKEMQIQRDRAYSPLIVIEDTQVHIDWNGIASDDGVSEPVGKNPLVEEGENVNAMMVSVNARNIGVGVAKNIHLTINTEKLLYDMVDALNKNTQCDSVQYKLNKDGDILYFLKGTKAIGSNEITYSDKLYLLPNAEESFSVGISPLLSRIVKEFFVEGLEELLKDYPITLNVSYQDIQGKDYSSEIELFCEPLLFEYGTDGSGYATYQIKSK